MAYDQRVVYGLCNVLNKHVVKSKLNLHILATEIYPVEHWAKRMDLIYRYRKSNWNYTKFNPAEIQRNLTNIEILSSNLLSELYNVEETIQKEISRDIKNGDFLKLRKEIREKIDVLKLSLVEVKRTNQIGSKLEINLDAVAAVEASVEIWMRTKQSKFYPKKFNSRTQIFVFITDCLEVFGFKDCVVEAYKNWYKLTQDRLA